MAEKNLNSRQQRCLHLLACGLNQRAIAKELNVSERTIHRWISARNFQQALGELQRSLWEETLKNLAGASATCLEYLVELVRDQGCEPRLRVRAAIAVLDSSLRCFSNGNVIPRAAPTDEDIARTMEIFASLPTSDELVRSTEAGA
jgi:orotate phosphoribosyltransferase-like protein